MYINRLFACCVAFFFWSISWSQTKTIDTVYVYEEIVIHDTIYIEKTLDNLTLHGPILEFKDKDSSVLSYECAGKNKKIELNKLVIKDSVTNKTRKMDDAKKSALANWSVGIRACLGRNYSSAFNPSNISENNGYGLGVLLMKRFLSKNWYVSAGLNVNYFPKSRTFENQSSESGLNGFYIANNQPNLLVKTFDECRQIILPVQIHYNIKKFVPSVGILYGLNTYYGTIQNSSGFIPLSLDQTIEAKLKSNFWGGNIELGYLINKYLIASVNYSFSKIKEIHFYENSTPLFTVKDNYTTSQLTIGVTIMLNAIHVKKRQ